MSIPTKMIDEYCQLMRNARYFDAHEILEDEWRKQSCPRGGLLQGLILLAVACEHSRRQNPGGARRVYTRAIKCLEAKADLPTDLLPILKLALQELHS